MKIECDISEITLKGDYDNDVPSVCATCTRCDNEAESYGTSERSVRRCLVLLAETCPMGEENYYVEA